MQAKGEDVARRSEALSMRQCPARCPHPAPKQCQQAGPQPQCWEALLQGGGKTSTFQHLAAALESRVRRKGHPWGPRRPCLQAEAQELRGGTGCLRLSFSALAELRRGWGRAEVAGPGRTCLPLCLLLSTAAAPPVTAPFFPRPASAPSCSSEGRGRGRMSTVSSPAGPRGAGPALPPPP